uniref:Uncharacterized protein n=1 Tax=Oryza glumipatula TaxID=40148 RepID=A0A0E0BPZ1_9ORYZ
MASTALRRRRRRSGPTALGAAIARARRRLVVHLPLGEIQAKLPVMEAAVRPIRVPWEYIDCAVGPAAAVHSLEPPLLAASTVTDDLPGYLAKALHFLSDNCGIASQWLADIVEYLEDRSLAATIAFSHLAATAAASSPAASSFLSRRFSPAAAAGE